MSMKSMPSVIPISAFKDNYIWMLHDSAHAWVVDPGDANPVIEALQANHLILSGVLLTHHHADHSGGISTLLKYAGQVPVFGGHKSAIREVNCPMKSGDAFACGPFSFKVIEIPGHTLDHVAFYNDELLFCGDTLFSAGCGRVFEGTYEQMYDSLCHLLKLKDDLKVFCGHEYTLANLQFAQHIEPDNAQIACKLLGVKEMLMADESCTLPSTLGEEKLINPFLRCDIEVVINAVESKFKIKTKEPAKIFQCLREWKNNFI